MLRGLNALWCQNENLKGSNEVDTNNTILFSLLNKIYSSLYYLVCKGTATFQELISNLGKNLPWVPNVHFAQHRTNVQDQVIEKIHS